jgi:tetratricopeptide (TPR) repeat protein
MHAENRKDQYHPALRAAMWIIPLAALAVIAAALIGGGSGDEPGKISIVPPEEAGIPYVGFAEIDTVIAGGSSAFQQRRYDEASRLLSRARFFIQSGIREGRFDSMPPNLEMILGLADYLRGYPLKGILYLTAAADSDPDNAEYTWYLGQMLLAEGKGEEAEKWLRKTVSLGGAHSAEAEALLSGM